jgi:hypothetical protein
VPSLQKRAREIPPEQRMAAIAAIVLVLSMALPWYSAPSTPAPSSGLVIQEPERVRVFTFVEAAICSWPAACCS